jgi:subtilisin
LQINSFLYKLKYFIFIILLLFFFTIIFYDFPFLKEAATSIGIPDRFLIGDLQSSQFVPTGLQRIGIDGESIDSYFTSIDVDIAILDTGVDSDHPDLNIFNEVNFVGSTPDDRCGHGTHVAGIIGAKNNEFGIVGVAPDARIWNVKISDCSQFGDIPVGSFESVLHGLDYVINNSDAIDVLNISQNEECPSGTACDDSVYREKIDQIINSGIVVVASAGNNDIFADEYIPPKLENVITVSAISDTDGKCGGLGPVSIGGDHDDMFAKQSNFGDAVDIAAPGIDIVSTIPNDTYRLMSGTSMAAPYVAGTAGLLKSFNNDLSAGEIESSILNSASHSETECDGEARGYFKGDKDQNSEPLLYIKDLILK